MPICEAGRAEGRPDTCEGVWEKEEYGRISGYVCEESAV